MSDYDFTTPLKSDYKNSSSLRKDGRKEDGKEDREEDREEDRNDTRKEEDGKEDRKDVVEDEFKLNVLSIKSLTSNIKLISHCQCIDLLAIITINNILEIHHALNYQTIFIIDIVEGGNVNEILWRYDGKILIYIQDNKYTCIEIETGNIIYVSPINNNKNSNIVATWSYDILTYEQKFKYNSKPFHDTMIFNTKLPSLINDEENIYYKSVIDDAHPLNSYKLIIPSNNKNLYNFMNSSLDLLLIADSNGNITYNAYGSIKLTTLKILQLLDNKYKSCHILNMYLNHDISRLNIMIILNTENESNLYLMNVTNTIFLSKRNELRYICKWMQTFDTLIDYIMKNFTSLSQIWKEAYDPINKKFSMINSCLQSHNQESLAEVELTSFLASGILDSGLLEFISEYLNDQLLTRMQTSINTSFATISKVLNRSILPACEQIIVALNRILLLSSEADLQCLGIETTRVEECLELAMSYMRVSNKFQVSESKLNYDAFFVFMSESVAKFGEAVLAANRQAQLNGERVERRPFRSLDHKRILNFIQSDLYNNRIGKFLTKDGDSSSIVINLVEKWNCIQLEMNDNISTYFDLLNQTSITSCSTKSLCSPFSATILIKDCDFFEENSLIVEKIVREKVETQKTFKPTAANTLMAFLKPDVEDEEEIIEKSDISMEIDESMDLTDESENNNENYENSVDGINAENMPSSLLRIIYARETNELIISFFVFFNGSYYLSLIKLNESNQRFCSFINLPIFNSSPVSFEFFNEGEIGLLYHYSSLERKNQKSQLCVVSIEDAVYYDFNSFDSSNAPLFFTFLESITPTDVEFKISEYYDVLPNLISVSNGRRLGAITGKNAIILMDLENQNLEMEDEEASEIETSREMGVQSPSNIINNN